MVRLDSVSPGLVLLDRFVKPGWTCTRLRLTLEGMACVASFRWLQQGATPPGEGCFGLL